MTKLASVVFLLDVDNTLLDNDRVIEDLKDHLTQAFGLERQARYWAIFEKLGVELGCADYLGALQRYRAENPRDPHFLQLSFFLLDYPFANRLFPGSLGVIEQLRTWGPTVILSDGDTIYARGFSAAAAVGTHYNVVRVGDALRDPESNKVVGYDGIYTGSGRVTRTGDPATLTMTESALETELGDKLFPGGVDMPLDFIPAPPKVKVDGRIMAVSDGVTMIGQYEVVVINRGARDGLIPGNVLAVFEVGGYRRDTEHKGYFAGMTGLGGKRVRLPDERTGTFMVFKTFDHMSYGLIMEAKNVIRVADRVENP